MHMMAAAEMVYPDGWAHSKVRSTQQPMPAWSDARATVLIAECMRDFFYLTEGQGRRRDRVDRKQHYLLCLELATMCLGNVPINARSPTIDVFVEMMLTQIFKEA